MDMRTTATLLPTEEGILEFLDRSAALFPADAADAPVARQREWYDSFCAAFDRPMPAGLVWEDADLAGIPVRHYAPSVQHTAARILYLHGGGFMLGSRASHHAICAEIAEAIGARLVSVDYRLAPEHLWPAASDDAFAVLRALLGAGEDVVAVGDSAGATLAAGIALRERDAPALPGRLCGQALIYPALGGELTRGSYVEMAEAPGLSTADVAYYRQLLQAPEDDPIAHPLRGAQLAGLPPTYVTAARFDPLCDDAAAYAAVLTRAGVECWYRLEPQMVHGWLRARHSSEGAAAGFAALLAALRYLTDDRRRSAEGGLPNRAR
ncbi:alpha/beta hydrolase [Frigidibacter albus]|nr:alpha/beta hydrolase [Frigidibacter albus]